MATPTPVADTTAWLILAALAGLVVASLWLRRRDRLAYERSLEQEAAARAVAEDRLAIARDLHDAVSGSLGAITVRSAVAQRLDTQPEALLQALRDIEAASREATDGLRSMLGVLRGGAGLPAPTASAAQRPAPQPALATVLEAAVAQARRNGVQAAVESSALTTERPLPAPLIEAAGAVAREALSNTARHAGPVDATIRVWESHSDDGPGELNILVTDSGPAPDWQAQPGTGTGLRGLGERIEALGGRLLAGQYDDGTPGFAVEARLPLADPPTRPRPAARRQRRAGGGQ